MAASSSLISVKLDPFFMLWVCKRRSRVSWRLNPLRNAIRIGLHCSDSRHAVRFRYLMWLSSFSTNDSNSASPSSISWQPVMFKLSKLCPVFVDLSYTATIECLVNGFLDRSRALSRDILLIGSSKNSIISASQIEFSAILSTSNVEATDKRTSLKCFVSFPSSTHNLLLLKFSFLRL